MKVLHWYPSFMRGGAVANAVRGLSIAQSQLGVQVAIATSHSAEQPLYYPLTDFGSVQIFEWVPRMTFQYKNVLLRVLPQDMIKQCLDFNPDIIHVHGEFNPDNLRVPHLFKRPVIISPRGGFHPVVLNKGLRNFKRIYFNLAKQVCYKHVCAFHALSPMESKHISALIENSQVYCVPQGPNLWLLQDSPSSQMLKNDESLKLIFVGRLDVYTKGLDFLIKALAHVVKIWKDKPVHLTLVGPDLNDGRRQLEALSKALQVQDIITFRGTLTGANLRNALDASDIYIQLSRHEALSSSALEALFMKLPAILSESVGLVSYPEIANLPHVKKVRIEVEEISTAIIEFGGQIATLKQNAAGASSKLQDFFSWQRTAEKHLENYKVYL